MELCTFSKRAFVWAEVPPLGGDLGKQISREYRNKYHNYVPRPNESVIPFPSKKVLAKNALHFHSARHIGDIASFESAVQELGGKRRNRNELPLLIIGTRRIAFQHWSAPGRHELPWSTPPVYPFLA